MDKSWMKIKNRSNEEYYLGVKKFLEFAYIGKDNHDKIPYPCSKCNNYCDQYKDIVMAHLIKYGIRKDYNRWIYHGEVFEDGLNDDSVAHNVEYEENDENDLDTMLNDMGTANWGENWHRGEDIGGKLPNDQESEADKFLQLLDDVKRDLYPGCDKFSKLSFIVTLLHLKTMSGWTSNSFDVLLGVFRDALPPQASIPKSFYEAKKIIRDLGFKYEKIHACVNDCVLYRKEYENLSKCPNDRCNEPRYKSDNSKVPRKVLRYFPLMPRLRKLYVNKEIARDMRWHKEKRVFDSNIMRHPADCEAWRHFDRTHEDFAQDPRNVRLGLATDGFNPFGNLSSAYSIWPVFLVPYNLPPWKCMKDPFLTMSLLIPGPKSPGNDIDVYLQPLVDELKELWIGVDAYDAYKGEKFTLRAALMWTINDFPAYAMLSGYSTKGYFACPCCMTETSCMHLRNSRKLCYTGHRRFLPKDHRWRKDKKAFNGEVDHRDHIVPMSGEEILNQIQPFEERGFFFGKAQEQTKKRKRQRNDSGLNWTKKSIFFYLPYWVDLKLRHNIDIMHVVKNVAESVVGTIMGIEGKNKDSWKVRKDLMDMGLRKELHLIPKGNSFVMPNACYSFTKDEKIKVCKFLASVKYPDGFASNISRCVKNGEFQMSGLKSHDCHIFMQRILPLVIRGCLTKDVRQVLFELSDFFRKLCCRTQYLDVLEEQEKNIAVILCKLERIFPPSFFDVMVHLLVHLPAETKIFGPPQYRWMFPFERKMGTLKGYVNNKARPEGCIAERYIDNECLNFCSLYLQDIDSKVTQQERNNEMEEASGTLSVFSSKGRPFGGPKYNELSALELAQIHAVVLNNCDEIEDYINEHKLKLEAESSANIDQRHDSEFPSWFEHRVMNLSIPCTGEIRSLALGPDSRIRRYSGCMTNGYRFHTKNREKERKTQNSGVVIKGEHGNTTIDFYGVLMDILEVEYFIGRKKVLLFKCEWFDLGDARGMQVDKESGVTSINVSRKWYSDQPYVLAQQVQQVFYVEDIKLGKNWFVVEKVNPRNYYDIPQVEHQELREEVYQEEEPEFVLFVDLGDLPYLARDVPLVDEVDASVVNAEKRASSIQSEHDFINDDDDDSDNYVDEDELWTDDDGDDDSGNHVEGDELWTSDDADSN